MTPRVPDFPALIQWIADKYHDGAKMRIAKEIGVSVPLVNQWSHGVIENPRTGNLMRLAERYDIDFMFIVRLVAKGRRPLPISGGSAAAATPLPVDIKQEQQYSSYFSTSCNASYRTLRRVRAYELHSYPLAA